MPRHVQAAPRERADHVVRRRIDTLLALDEVGARMPEDHPLVQSGSLGLHHYFALDGLLAKAAPFVGIDVQADGGMIVAPPSLHHSGRRYRWLRGLDSPWTPLPEWVRWACARISSPRHSAPTIALVETTTARIDVQGHQTRHHARDDADMLQPPELLETPRQSEQTGFAGGGQATTIESRIQ